MQSILQARKLGQKARTFRDVERPTRPVPTTRTIDAAGDSTVTGKTTSTLPEGVESQERKTPDGDETSLVFVVSWAGEDDPANPHNWSLTKRVLCTLLVSYICFVCMIASSIDAAIAPQAAQDFGVSPVVESLAIALFLIGSGVGSLFTGPFSETFGRNPIYLGTMMLFMIWVMASGLSPNIGAQLAFRFLAGVFGCAPLTCAGGTTSDLWNSLEKTWAFPLFAIPAFGGSMLGPAIGSYFGTHDLPSWRWTEWLTLILAGVVTLVAGLFLPETHPGTILRWRAKALRNSTKDDRYQSPVELSQVTFLHRMTMALIKPWTLIGEAIVIAFTLYLTVVWAVLFTFLDGYSYIFTAKYGISEAGTNVIFVAMYIGVLLSTPLVPLVYRWTKEDMEKSKSPGPVRAETRLWYSMLGASWAIPLSLFWLAWTDWRSVSMWSGIVSTAFFGFGLITIFMSAYMYIIDAYEVNAASALTLATVVRFFISGGLTVAGIPFYENVGTHWTLTIMAVISALLAPVPYLLYAYGPWVRKHSKHAVNRYT